MQYTYGGNQQQVLSATPIRGTVSFPFPSFRSSGFNQPQIQQTAAADRSIIGRNGRPRLSHGPTQATAIQKDEPPNSVLMKWGEPCWTLFHVLAEKARPESFSHIRNELIDIIVLIACNLPCPNCSGHASQYLKRVNLNAIQTQDQLRYFLFEFHNSVNVRKHVSPYAFENVSSRYSLVNTGEVIHRFMYFYEGKYTRTNHLVAQGFARANITRKLKDWFDKNIGAFN